MWLRLGRVGQANSTTDNEFSFVGAIRQRLSAMFSPSPGIKKQVARALMLRCRGGVLKDNALQIQTLSARLQIVCFARKVHPWDQDLPEAEQNQLFARQCLQDVDKAITSLFQQLSEVTEVDVTIVTPDGNTKLITGVVHRDSLSDANQASVGMRLLTKGLHFRLHDRRLEPMA